jgi:ubiquinone/menaquinone biosynthesis C-methylase UbiE
MTRPPWFVDELEHAGREHLDPLYVEGFDRKSSFDPIPELALLADFGFGSDSTLIDLGAGTGTLALAAAQICRQVVAVDVSPAMLDALAAKARRQLVNNLQLVREGLLAYQHRGELADFVYTKNALHHLPDFWKAVALRRIVAMLKRGGILRLRDIVYSFEPHESEAVIEAWLGGAPERSEDGWTRSELETHVREEYSTFAWLLEPMLERSGFEIKEATYSDSRVFASYTCVKL